MDSSTQQQQEATLVRGADGELYLITKTEPPIKIKSESGGEKIIGQLEECLSKHVQENHREEFGGTRFIHLVFPEVVPKK